jgi:hypothetical protein
MKEDVISNLNYNISYWFFLPAAVYYCLLVQHDLTSNCLLFLSLLSFAAVLHPPRHRLLHIVIALLLLLDLLLKALMLLKVLPGVDAVWADLGVLRNIANMGS